MKWRAEGREMAARAVWDVIQRVYGASIPAYAVSDFLNTYAGLLNPVCIQVCFAVYCRKRGKLPELCEQVLDA